MRWSEIDTVPCPIAQGLAVLGDAWTLLIIRDCFHGYSKFEDFQRRTRASRAMLSSRLASLTDYGILVRSQYQDNPPRYDYHLTPRGKALRPVMMTLAHWAESQALSDRTPVNKRRHKSCGL